MREDLLVLPVDQWLASAFRDRERMVEQLAGQLVTGIVPRSPSLGAAHFEAKLARYQAALDAGADAAVVAKWIAETQRERDQAARQRPQEAKIMTKDDINALITELGGMAEALKHAEPEDKAKLYRSLKLRLTYAVETQTVLAKIDLGEHRWDSESVRGGT